jgi:hypothetical protein
MATLRERISKNLKGVKANVDQIFKSNFGNLFAIMCIKSIAHCPFPHQFVDQGQNVKILISEST